MAIRDLLACVKGETFAWDDSRFDSAVERVRWVRAEQVVVPRLTELMRHGSTSERHRAVWALYLIGPNAQSTDALRELAENPNEHDQVRLCVTATRVRWE